MLAELSRTIKSRKPTLSLMSDENIAIYLYSVYFEDVLEWLPWDEVADEEKEKWRNIASIVSEALDHCY